MRDLRSALLVLAAPLAIATHAGCNHASDAQSSSNALGPLAVEGAGAGAEPAAPSIASASAAETCGNDIDDDGNGSIDDGCPCDADRACTLASNAPAACRAGVQRCTASGEFRRYDRCRPLVDACADPTPTATDDAGAEVKDGPDAALDVELAVDADAGIDADAGVDAQVDAQVDADGAVDAGPTRSSAFAVALAVSSSGRVITTDGHSVRCLDANLAPEVAPITVPSGAWRPIVVRSRTSERAAYFVRNGTAPNRTLAIVLFDASCALTKAITIEAASGEIDEFVDGAIDDAGNVYVLFQDGVTRTMRSYAPDGSIRFEATEPRGGNGAHLAIRSSTGEGVIAYQEHYTSPIRYRRFSAGGAWLDANDVPIAATVPTATNPTPTSWYDAFTIGMNDSGGFAVSWVCEEGPSHLWLAAFDAGGHELATVDLGVHAPGTWYDTTRFSAGDIPITPSGDFFVPLWTPLSPAHAYAAAAYSSTGILHGIASLARLRLETAAFDGAGNAYVIDDDGRVNKLAISVGP